MINQSDYTKGLRETVRTCGTACVTVGNVCIGGGKKVLIAGPCAVESEEQIVSIAREVKDAGAHILRGGAFKPRTSPYTFQGLEEQGLAFLITAKHETGLPIVSEITSIRHIELFAENVDLIQVGSRNMYNYDLLKELGQISKPIMLKRGASSTIYEWLMSAEHIISGGNKNVILCERGLKSFDNLTRNMLDISAVAAVKELSCLPIIVDPSHASGLPWMIPSLALAGIAAGADGIMVEVHSCPENALCDAQQAISPVQFAQMSQKIHKFEECF